MVTLDYETPPERRRDRAGAWALWMCASSLVCILLAPGFREFASNDAIGLIVGFLAVCTGVGGVLTAFGGLFLGVWSWATRGASWRAVVAIWYCIMIVLLFALMTG